MTSITRWLVGAAMLLGVSLAQAQAYPAKPIRFVIGFPAGSSIDVISRIALDDIRSRTGATIVIENKPGALGVLGMELVQRAEPDGYTLMPSSSATHSSGPYLSKALQRLDPVKSLTHIARVARFDVAVVTRASGPYKTAKALVDAGKAKPDSLTYGFGSGTGQVGSAAFSHAAGISVRPIPYKGQPAAVTDLLGGQIDFVASDLGAVLTHLRQGTLNAVAVLAEQRSPLLPDALTAREAGLPPVILGGWLGFDGPGGLPPNVIAWWDEQVQKAVQNPAVVEKMRTAGMVASALTGPAFVRFVESEQDRWGTHVRQAGMQPE